MRRVILESPFKANEKHTAMEHYTYALDCLRDCLKRGEAPFASHMLYPLVLNDADEAERGQGMGAGWAWVDVADAVVVYTDFGISGGMQAGIGLARTLKKPIEYRSIQGTDNDEGRAVAQGESGVSDPAVKG